MSYTLPCTARATHWSIGYPHPDFVPSTFEVHPGELGTWLDAHPGTVASSVVSFATQETDAALKDCYQSGDFRPTESLRSAFGMPVRCGSQAGCSPGAYCGRRQALYETWFDDVYRRSIRQEASAVVAAAGDLLETRFPDSFTISSGGVLVHNGQIWPVYAVRCDTRLAVAGVAADVGMFTGRLTAPSGRDNAQRHLVVTVLAPDLSVQALTDALLSADNELVRQRRKAHQGSSAGPGGLFLAPDLSDVAPDPADLFLGLVADPVSGSLPVHAPAGSGPLPKVVPGGRLTNWFDLNPGLRVKNPEDISLDYLDFQVREFAGWPAAGKHPGRDTAVRPPVAVQPGRLCMFGGVAWPSLNLTGPDWAVRIVIAALHDLVPGGVCRLDTGSGPAGSSNTRASRVTVTVLVPFREGIALELEEAFAVASGKIQGTSGDAGVCEYLVLPGSKPQVFAVENESGRRVLRKVLTTTDGDVADRLAQGLTCAATPNGLTGPARVDLLGFAEEYLPEGPLGAVRDELDRLTRA